MSTVCSSRISQLLLEFILMVHRCLFSNCPDRIGDILIFLRAYARYWYFWILLFLAFPSIADHVWNFPARILDTAISFKGPPNGCYATALVIIISFSHRGQLLVNSEHHRILEVSPWDRGAHFSPHDAIENGNKQIVLKSQALQRSRNSSQDELA